jgi:hypothetical protein
MTKISLRTLVRHLDEQFGSHETWDTPAHFENGGYPLDTRYYWTLPDGSKLVVIHSEYLYQDTYDYQVRVEFKSPETALAYLSGLTFDKIVKQNLDELRSKVVSSFDALVSSIEQWERDASLRASISKRVKDKTTLETKASVFRGVLVEIQRRFGWVKRSET